MEKKNSKLYFQSFSPIFSHVDNFVRVFSHPLPSTKDIDSIYSQTLEVTRGYVSPANISPPRHKSVKLTIFICIKLMVFSFFFCSSVFLAVHWQKISFYFSGRKKNSSAPPTPNTSSKMSLWSSGFFFCLYLATIPYWETSKLTHLWKHKNDDNLFKQL